MRKKVSDTAAAVLAGGKNSRMQGENKAFIRMAGVQIISRTLKLLEGIFEEIILVTNSPQDFKPFTKKAIITKDIIKGIGPLGGIHAGLSAASKKSVFFVACDMPFLHNAIIRYQLELFSKIDCDCLMPRMGFFTEPLHAIYKKRLKDSINTFVKDSCDYSVRNFLRKADVYYWDLKNSGFRQYFLNLNTREDLKKAKGCLVHRGRGYRAHKI